MPSLLDISGIPSATPTGGQGGETYQHVQTSPEMFGAAQGVATQRVASAIGSAEQQIAKTRGLYNQITADDAYNQTADYITKKMHGDPDAVGPDGSPDVGYMGLKGSDALNGRKPLMDDIDAYIKKQRENLRDPEAILHFDMNSRRLRTQTADSIGRHADGQFVQYTNGVNNGTANSAINRIAASPNDDAAFAIAQRDLTSAYIKESQNIGQNSDEAIRAATEKATRDSLKARALAISSGDPSAGNGPAAAMKYIQDHQKELGTEYASLYQHFEAKNNKAVGTGAGAQVFAGANAAVTVRGAAALPVFAQAAAAVPGGMSPAGAVRLVQIESGFKANPNPGGKYQGYVQAGAPYWQRYGGGGSPFNLNDSVMAVMRSTAADRQTLASGLGRDPGTITDGELYLAHQQGPGGALALMRNPDMPAADALASAYKGNRALAAQAIRLNGGNPDAPARDFVAKWTYKFGGEGGMPSIAPGGGQMGQMPQFEGPPQSTAPQTPAGPAPAQPELVSAGPTLGQAPGTTAPQAAAAPIQMSPEEKYALVASEAIRQVLDRKDLNQEQREYAISHIKEMAQTFAIADGANQRARKRADESASLDWTKKILTGDISATTRNEILHDPRISEASTASNLVAMLEKRAGETPEMRAAKYGAGYQPLLKNIVAPDSEETRISSQKPLLQAYLNGQISDAGLSHLQGVLKEASEGKTGNSTLLSTAMERAKRVMVLNSVKDPLLGSTVDDEVGQEKLEQFTHVFVEGLQKTIEAGKSVADYTDPKNVDKIMEQVYPRSERVANALSFGQHSMSSETAAKMQPKLPPPNIKPEDWWKAVDAAPARNGVKAPPGIWSEALTRLAADPTPQTIDAFNKHFRGTVDGRAILQQLGVIEKPAAAPVTAPPPPAPAPRAPTNTFSDQVARRAEKQAGQPSIGSVLVDKVKGMLPETGPLAPGTPANAMAANANSKEAAR